MRKVVKIAAGITFLLLFLILKSTSYLTNIITNDTISYNDAPSTSSNNTQQNACPLETMNLTCSEEWMSEAVIDNIVIPQGLLVSKSKQATEIKLCEYKYKQQDGASSQMIADVIDIQSSGLELPTGVALLKCNNALIEFGHKWRQGKITCGGTPPLSLDSDKVHENTDVLFATALQFPNIMQHAIQNGLDSASTMWNYVKGEVPDIHILTGTDLKGLYISLTGTEERIHINTDPSSKWFFRSLYMGYVPSHIPLNNNLTHIPTDIVEMATNIRRDGDIANGSCMLPCSVQSMIGFSDWIAKFSGTSSQVIHNGTLLYLQRINTKRSCVYWDCGKDGIMLNGTTCSCQSVPEEVFIERLRDLGRRHGLETQVFHHTTFQKDAEIFAKARVVVGPHGGAFANIIFLNPMINPLMIETNLKQEIYDCCREGGEPPRHFFMHLASSLGVRYRSFQPHVWRKYGGKDPHMSSISLETNEYLDYIDKAIKGIDGIDPTIQLSASKHSCIPYMAG